MGSFSRLLALGLLLLQPFVASFGVPHYFQSEPLTRRDLSPAKVQTELGALISKNSTIFGPTDPRFPNATERYNTAAPPHIEVVVIPGLESDIPTIVKYCNENSIDFFAINRAHARTYTVGSFTGLMIDMGGLLNIEIQPDNKSAWFQGGTYDGQVMSYLWEKGFVATTGSCDCVGMMGPALGGGHGRNEGLYGLISDNFVNLNVVLADGTAIRVNETSHADLLWAMKGAGHNFGIVTSFELKIYPRQVDTWYYHNYIWKGDKLEEAFEKANTFHDNGNTPVNMAFNYATFLLNETISKTEAIISWSFAYRGSAEDAEKLLVPFNEIEAVYEETGDVSFPEISEVQATAIDDPTCARNNSWIMSTANLKIYNITTTRQVYDLNNEYIRKYPQLLNPSVLHEGYANVAVRRFKSEDSAYPFRDYNHLTSFQVEVPPGSNLTPVALQWAADLRTLWNDGQPDVQPSNYVNYATGLESLPSIYGYEEWRLQKLLDLKKNYDPQNRFRYYNPLISEGKA
ncbi:uncharacterized protein F4822DRAFT_423980 [Hypoxylon trugodes]|uniref:uncharacterized protein n=1 Tax=Hypoxylon trugodes TaxID=326681 RepID=UPI00218FA0EE|nr:uncharacterized protein F4822DRAFT_423980 [Hypoxylon trugodes]KAI1393510.1 hypothetical protein F4822DRAFT_423980 [Hypoxylon trugodes]